MRPTLALAMLLATVLGSLGLAAPAAAATPHKVAIIVGPVGEELTPVYLALAETASLAAEARGATVARAFSPEASATNVLAAVEGASIVVYFGHGVGTPNPYSANPDRATVNGWGLNGPAAVGTHADSWSDGTLAYYGEEWIAANARPAPGWVMIYSNACYAPGASEGFDEPADQATAASRVAGYSRAPLAELGAGAYFATDFYEGAAHLVGALLDSPATPFGEIFASEPRFAAEGVTRLAHPAVAGAETWLQRSAYFEGKLDYWYAFAGNPAASLGGPGASAGLPDEVVAPAEAPPLGAADGLVTGMASSYGESGGWEGQPTVALPVQLGGGSAVDTPTHVLICADRCASLPVVDSCPCYVGTPDQRVANLSHAAWQLLSDMPLEEGLIQVEIYTSPISAPGVAPDS